MECEGSLSKMHLVGISLVCFGGTVEMRKCLWVLILTHPCLKPDDFHQVH